MIDRANGIAMALPSSAMPLGGASCQMTAKDMKAEIQRKLDEVPEAILEEILGYLRGFQAKTPEEQKRLIGLKRILNQKRDLLLRLAQ